MEFGQYNFREIDLFDFFGLDFLKFFDTCDKSCWRRRRRPPGRSTTRRCTCRSTMNWSTLLWVKTSSLSLQLATTLFVLLERERERCGNIGYLPEIGFSGTRKINRKISFGKLYTPFPHGTITSKTRNLVTRSVTSGNAGRKIQRSQPSGRLLLLCMLHSTIGSGYYLVLVVHI